MRFHHVGYAVGIVRAYLEEFLTPLFAPVDVGQPISDPIQQVKVCFVTMRGGTVIELVEPLGEKSPVRSIIGSSHGGIYHLCSRTDDFDQQVGRFHAKRCLRAREAGTGHRVRRPAHCISHDTAARSN